MDAIREGLMRPFIAVDLEVHQPIPGPAKAYFRPFVGRMKSAMYRDGVIHHFRVVDDDGVMWLVPPAWLPSYSLQVATMAMDWMDAQFLHTIRTVPRDVIWAAVARVLEMPEGSTPAEMKAWIERRDAELVH